MNTAHIRLNLNKGTQPAGDEITIAQGDKHGLTITATIYDGTEKATLTGYTAHIVAQLPDRTHYYRETATINGSDVTAVIDETKIGTIPGHTDNAYFTLEATDGTIYSTARFGIDILNDALSDTTAAETYDNEIEALVKDAQSAINKANEAYATLDVTQIKKTASEDFSSAGGYYTRARAKYQTVRGKFNADDADALFIVGNGTADSSRSNAFAVHSDGDIIPGKIASISTMLYPAGAVIAGTATLDTSGLGGTWSSIGTLTIGTTEVTFYQRTA